MKYIKLAITMFLFAASASYGITYAQKLNELEMACMNDDVASCSKLGVAHTKVMDFKKAAFYFEKACSLNDEKACTNLGAMYRMGHGVDHDDKIAFEYFEKGCDNGDFFACTNIGAMYSKGDGVDVDVEKALEYYEIGCSGEVGVACATLGNIYKDGASVKKDPERAKKYFEKSCHYGHQYGCEEYSKFKQLITNKTSKTEISVLYQDNLLIIFRLS